MPTTQFSQPFPGYEILEAFGPPPIRYRACDLRNDRLVLLRPTGVAGDLPADAARARSVRHPHIVKLYDVIRHEGMAVLVLEFVPDSLARRLNGTPWPARQAAQLMEKVASAVDAIHEAGRAHGHLWPENILLTREGEPKVTGLQAPEEPDSAVGVSAYMAPEWGADLCAPATPATDLFSLGVIFYQLLTGQLPFRGATDVDTLEQVRTKAPLPPSRVCVKAPRDLDMICLKCLEKRPEDRYASAEALASDLYSFLHGAPKPAAPGLFERAWRRLGRR